MDSNGHVIIPHVSTSPSTLPVTLEPVETILPSAPTDASPLYLSYSDSILALTVLDLVYFYPYTGDEDPIRKLRRSLADVLVPYHFMAGRFRGSGIGKLEIDCNRKGVLFAPASTELAIADLGDLASPNLAFRSLVLTPPSGDIMTENPLLMVQVTRFRCGGLAIGFSINHATLDGLGITDFLSNFSSLARGEGLIIEPKPNRTMFKPRDPPEITFDHPDILSVLPSLFTTGNNIADTNLPPGLFTTANNIADINLPPVFKTLPVSGEMLKCLKSLAIKDHSLKKCSSFDAIAAHVWQTRTRAAKMPADAPSKAFFVLDVRNKLNPPLPKGFAGNGVSVGFASVPAKELEDGSFSFAVKKIQEGKEAVTEEYVKSLIDLFSVHGSMPQYKGGLFMSAWWKLPFFEVDFGWGKPNYFGPIIGHDMKEVVLFLSNGTPHGLNVFIGLEPHEMEAFEKLFYKDW